ncbi:uncharacterized protein LOC111353968 [Spodoptera litura]|uniref:Uncharacterized protein LOC111353968 n=1 Tax=Spodoptera litura TaxID=69820 RepID=A0A9J7IR84_SPOLT|nr:uncharacterized protein LOC111353968 [Spodoptera litura]
MEANVATDGNKILQNSLLFNALRKNKTSEQKIRKIKKYLSHGADVNAIDANNNCNTPLHIAVLKGGPEVVRFLLDIGANATLKNNSNQTAFDIAQQPDTINGSDIISLFKSYDYDKQRKKVYDEKEITNINDQISKIQIHKIVENTVEFTKENFYRKRNETSGLGGQLYETKLITLVLLRILNCEQINDFLLGSNMESVGAFDDIICRYDVKGGKKPKILFLQAKHRENPTKGEITIDELLKQNGDFSLCKYFDSYLKITRKFSPNNDDKLFRGSVVDVDCYFIIFTSALENFSKKKNVNHNIDFLKTNHDGKIFQYNYDDNDLRLLSRNICISRVVALAKRLCQFILKDNKNYKNMMMDELLKSFHVYLAQNVITSETIQDSTKETFLLGKFRESFLTSNDELLLLMNKTINTEILESKKLNDHKCKFNMQSLTFKLPINFGNDNFTFSGSDAKKQRRLTYLSSKFEKLVSEANNKDINKNQNYILVNVDDSMIGPNKILQDSDMESYRFGGLIGNLLVVDCITKTLKFNLAEHALSEDNVKLLDMLKEKLSDLDRFRFEFKTFRLPRLTLYDNDYDRSIVRDFLEKVYFFTNQAKENEVEDVVKLEIDEFCHIKQNQNETLFKIKRDAIFLRVHDRIQKWWRQSLSAPYLTPTCKFFHEAQNEILETPLLGFLNIMYRENLKSISVKFLAVAIQLLSIDKFLNGSESALIIYSDEFCFTCIKIVQYFQENNLEQGCIFIDLEYVIHENFLLAVQTELTKSKINKLVVVFQNNDFKNKVTCESIKDMLINFKGKVIIVTNSKLRGLFDPMLKENIVQVEDKDCLTDLVREYRDKVLKKRNIIFQGNELALHHILDHKSSKFVSGKVLRKMLNNEKIQVGKELVKLYYNTLDIYYINRVMYRYVTLDVSVTYHDLLIVHSMQCNDCLSMSETKLDIIFISQASEEYDDFCTEHKGNNVHWFKYENNCYVWKKSKGSLKVLLKYVERKLEDEYGVRPKFLKDIDEKCVIICAGSGMGKSTLLTYLTIQTKRILPKMWIANINLLDYIDELSKWKEDGTNINDIVEVIKFLFAATSAHFKKPKVNNLCEKDKLQQLLKLIAVDGARNTIYLRNIDLESECNELGLLELNLFTHYYNNNMITVVFDGLDEICPDYANEVTRLLETLKLSNVAHLWVTARSCNVVHELECILETFSYSLQELTPLQQEQFLEKKWSVKLVTSNAVQIRRDVKKFFKVLCIVLRDEENLFVSVPLHLDMISEMFFTFFKYYYENIDKYTDEYIEQVTNSFNLTSVYEIFVGIKFNKIRLGDEKYVMFIKDPDMRKMIEKERTLFLDNHKRIAAYFLLPKSVLSDVFTEDEINKIKTFVEHIKSGEERSGIIESMDDDHIQFVHVTYGEYFAAEFLFENFTTELRSLSYHDVFHQVFVTNKGIRRFIISKLLKDKMLFNLSNDTSHVCEVFYALMSLKYLPSNVITVEDYLDQIVTYFLICISTALPRETVTKYLCLFKKNCSRKYCEVCIAKDRKLNTGFLTEEAENVDDSII